MKTLHLIFFSILFSFFAINSVYSLQGSSVLLSNDDHSHITVNNRVLARVNGKSISVYDIMKKMDMLFYKQFPQYTTSIPTRFQFYKTNWQKSLQDIIDKELVLADAQENKFQLNNGDVRQEMEMLFGPNIVISLDKAGLTMEEATKMVEEDIILKRMLYIRANAKAIRSVTPQDIRKAYEDYAKENVRPETWEYLVITIRNKNSKDAADIASFASNFLDKERKPLDELKQEIETKYGSSTRITISEMFKHEEKELSTNYKDVLLSMPVNSYSTPSEQKSRSDNSVVYRIFFLKNKNLAGAPPLQEIENNLKDYLIDVAIENEIEEYIQKLRKHYNVEDGSLSQLLTEGFEPFTLQ